MRFALSALLATLAGCSLYFSHSSGDDTTSPPDAPSTDGDGSDGGHDTHAGCGDGTRATHEVCATTYVRSTDGSVRSARGVDVDGDGALDLAYLAPGHLVVIRGVGHGRLSSSEDPGTPNVVATHLAFGDVNGDGRIDAVTASSGTVTVFLNTGGGHFEAAGHSITIPNLRQMTVGNVARGAAAEIVVNADDSPTDTESGTLYVLRFDAATGLDAISETGVQHATSLSLADVDGDGYSDALVVDHTYYAQDDEVFAFLQGVASSYYLTSTAPVGALAFTDLDGDGVGELVGALDTGSGGVLSYHSASSGTSFASPAMSILQTGDLDADSLSDLIGAQISPPAVVVMTGGVGVRPGTAALARTFPVSTPILDLHVDGDFNGDGVPDPVVTLQESVVIVMSSPP